MSASLAQRSGNARVAAEQPEGLSRVLSHDQIKFQYPRKGRVGT